LRYPLSAATVGALLWIVAAVLFSSLGTAASPVIALSIGVTVILGGLSTCAVGYLLAERILRPVTARSLAAGPLARPAAPGVATRLTMAWALATAVPLLGIAALAITDLAGADIERGLLVIATLF